MAISGRSAAAAMKMRLKATLLNCPAGRKFFFYDFVFLLVEHGKLSRKNGHFREVRRGGHEDAIEGH